MSRSGATISRRAPRGMIRVRGEERLRWLERHTDVRELGEQQERQHGQRQQQERDVSEDVAGWFDVGNWVIWGVFAAVLLAKLAVAPDRWAYARSHPVEVLFVALPLLRPLGLLRALPLLRVAVAMGVNVSLFSRFFRQRGITFLAAMLLAVMFTGGILVWLLERGVSGHDALIETPTDAFWWAFITMTTVGYGDHSPATSGGRLIASIITVYGIINFAVIGAMAVAALTQERQRSTLAEMRDQLERIQEQLADLRAERRADEPPPER